MTDHVHPELEDALALAQVALEEWNAAERDCFLHASAKAIVRTGAIKRIMEQPAPSGKPHSWTSAEALRDTDDVYLEFKVKEAQLASARAQKEFDLFAARQRVEYLSRTLPPTAVEAGYTCVHGVALNQECQQCEDSQVPAA
jgi:hypothetical protein